MNEKARAKETILSGFHAFVAQDIDEDEFKQYIDMALDRLEKPELLEMERRVKDAVEFAKHHSLSAPTEALLNYIAGDAKEIE